MKNVTIIRKNSPHNACLYSFFIAFYTRVWHMANMIFASLSHSETTMTTCFPTCLTCMQCMCARIINCDFIVVLKCFCEQSSKKIEFQWLLLLLLLLLLALGVRFLSHNLHKIMCVRILLMPTSNYFTQVIAVNVYHTCIHEIYILARSSRLIFFIYILFFLK